MPRKTKNTTKNNVNKPVTMSEPSEMETSNSQAVSDKQTTPYTTGVVSNCIRLNIRKEPRSDAEVVTVVAISDELHVYLDSSTEDWYCVCTATGIDGFCMKTFVELAM